MRTRGKLALVLVEEDASDQWLLGSPEDAWDSPARGNIIRPPLTYGQAVAGTESGDPPATLIAGRTYEVILWRVLPAGSQQPCQARYENMCMIALKPFIR